jgi:hypothetical protein
MKPTTCFASGEFRKLTEHVVPLEAKFGSNSNASKVYGARTATYVFFFSGAVCPSGVVSRRLDSVKVGERASVSSSNSLLSSVEFFVKLLLPRQIVWGS